MTLSWWMLIPAVVIVLVWAGWFITAWFIDRGRSRDVSTETQRTAPDPAAEADINSQPDAPWQGTRDGTQGSPRDPRDGDGH